MTTTYFSSRSLMALRRRRCGPVPSQADARRRRVGCTYPAGSGCRALRALRSASALGRCGVPTACGRPSHFMLPLPSTAAGAPGTTGRPTVRRCARICYLGAFRRGIDASTRMRLIYVSTCDAA